MPMIFSQTGFHGLVTPHVLSIPQNSTDSYYYNIKFPTSRNIEYVLVGLSESLYNYLYYNIIQEYIATYS